MNDIDKKEKNRLYMKEWRKKNREKKNAANLAWAKKNKEKISKYRQDYNHRPEVVKKKRKKDFELYHNNPNYLARKKKYDKQRYLERREKIRLYRQAKGMGSQIWRCSKEYFDWRDAVFQRDSHTCQHCSKSGCKVHAHHIKIAKDNEDLRYDVSNGLTLCEECHKETHRNT